MAFSKTDFTLAWFATPVEQDWTNLLASNVQRVLLPLQLARSQPNVLARLSGIKRRAIIRVESDNAQLPADVAHELSDIRHIIPVDAVIIGTEADTGVDFTYKSLTTWGQDKAEASAVRVSNLAQAVQALGLIAVAPAMTWPPDMISEDGIPQPGRTTFQEITRGSYDRCDGVASHCGYVLGWTPVGGDSVERKTNVDRFKVGLKREVETWHKDVWLDECTFPTDDDMLQMQCAIDQAEIIMAGKCNDRVKMLCPFISEGFINGSWDARYIIRDPAAYELLGRYLSA